MAIETTCCVCSAHQVLILLLVFPYSTVHAHSKAKGQRLSVLAASGEETRLRATVNHIGSILRTAHQVLWRQQPEAEHSGSS